jgi:lipid II:glycine glycyltransferase (peptidoglycan interpeptide bridge formation enzyme)
MKGIKGSEPFFYRETTPGGETGSMITGIRNAGGGSLKRYFTSRVVILGEPHFSNQVKSKLQKTSDWQFTDKLKNNSIYTELRLLEPVVNKAAIQSVPYTHCIPYLNILVDTTPAAETLYSNLSSTKKRQVQSAVKAGATVRKAESEEEVEIFYQLLQKLYREKIKKPLLAKEVFLRIYRNKSLGEIFLVFYNKRIVGGMLCPVFEKKEMYEWYIAGLDDEMKKHKVFPSVLLTWEVIKYASQNGYSRFNFMGAGIKGKYYGVRDFKLQFGGKLVDAPRYIIVHKPMLYRLGKLAVKLGFGS